MNLGGDARFLPVRVALAAVASRCCGCLRAAAGETLDA
jgi:hypothetical protein